MRRFFRNLNLNKRKIWSVGIITVIFVMSLGYAALSQHMDIDGVTVIDRNWIVKITDVNATEVEGGINNSNTYVSSTATFNVTLPNANSKVAYDVTISNQGNLVAKLSNIEVIEDNNSSIKYEINSSSIAEGDLVKPGKSKTVNLYIGYVDGVENVSNTEKSIMITFNFIEDSGNSINGSGNVPVSGQKEYSVGDEVTLIDGSRWHVSKNSGSNEELVTLFSANSIADCSLFDADADNTTYEPYNDENIGYCLNNTYLPKLKSSLSAGNTTGLAVRLLTYDEYYNLKNINPMAVNIGGSPQVTWVMSDGGMSVTLQSDGNFQYSNPVNATFAARPVITILKSNIVTTLAEKILANNDEVEDDGRVYMVTSTSTGLLYTNENTQNNKRTYYFRGNVTNNYVYFAGMTWRIMRINEDGSIRLVANNFNVDPDSFAKANGDNTYVGYMTHPYTPTLSYADATANIADSAIKQQLDEYYIESNLHLYSSYLADTGFCNDRSNTSSYGASSATYAGVDRIEYTGPQFACPNKNDLFTVANTSGNQALTFPIGTVTMDDLVYAGASIRNTYLPNNGSSYWTMTPVDFISGEARMFVLEPSGYFNYQSVYGLDGGTGYEANDFEILPVINLKANVKYKSGNGTTSSPYTIETFTEQSLVETVLGANGLTPDDKISTYVESDHGINFSSISSDYNGTGLYYTNKNTLNNQPTYYFRGDVKNNYISFANKIWRIIRINEDGSIRIILNSSAGTSAYNSSYSDNAHVGYMYGTASSSTLSSTHANTNSSNVKTFLENWYKNNLNNYSNFIADPGFCNDRSVASSAGSWDSRDTALGYGQNITYYGAYFRVQKGYVPQFGGNCSNSDFFTVGSGVFYQGNARLAYPIGLITVDEVMYAGGKYNTSNANNYLNMSTNYWTMSPYGYAPGSDANYPYIYYVNTSGAISASTSRSSLVIRPVISLKNGVKITGGDGTSGNPYVIKTS